MQVYIQYYIIKRTVSLNTHFHDPGVFTREASARSCSFDDERAQNTEHSRLHPNCGTVMGEDTEPVTEA